MIHSEDFNSNKIQFRVDYINNYYKDDEYHYLLIIFHYKNMNSDNMENQRIYSIPNIYDNIINIIDNLEDPIIKL